MIVVGGEALVDLVVAADGSLSAHLGGGPYNAARTMARLGAPAAFLGRLSDDHFGRALRRTLTDDGVSADLVVPTDDPTTLALAELDERGAASYRFYIEKTSAPGLTKRDALRALEALSAIGRPAVSPAPFAVHVGTLGLVLDPMASAYQAVIERLAGQALIMIDANCRPVLIHDRDAYWSRMRAVLAHADVLKASDEDLTFLAECAGGLSVADVLKLGPQVVLYTMGAEGVDVVTMSSTTHLDTPPTKVVDTIGAGDAFGGGFLASWFERGLGRAQLADDDAVITAARFATLVASRTCERAGANPPWRDEL